MVVIGKRWLYLGKVLLLEQKWLFSDKVVVFGQGGCIHAEVVVLTQSGFIRAKVVVFGEKCYIPGNPCCIRAKVVAFGQSGCGPTATMTSLKVTLNEGPDQALQGKRVSSRKYAVYGT